MTFHRVTVLGSACDAYPIADELCAAGVEVDTWILPEDCTGREAAALAELAAMDGQWAGQLADTELIITAFRDSRALTGAVVPYVLPHLPIGSVWLQMGQAARDETDGLALAADGYDISFRSAQLVGEMPTHFAGPHLFGPIGAGTGEIPDRLRAHLPLELLTPWRFGLLPAWDRPALQGVRQQNSIPSPALAGSLMTRRDPIWDRIGAERQRQFAKTGQGDSLACGRDSQPSQRLIAGARETETSALPRAFVNGPGISGGEVVHHHAAPP
ncbi:hypothetical protein [Streptomyces sp. NPDC005408]|uniref:hypothetical protein n=1 Tax=Streptomyces sp. NPDC005408 TaxID=3155341 RepID=UPI0033A756FA